MDVRGLLVLLSICYIFEHVINQFLTDTLNIQKFIIFQGNPFHYSTILFIKHLSHTSNQQKSLPSVLYLASGVAKISFTACHVIYSTLTVYRHLAQDPTSPCYSLRSPIYKETLRKFIMHRCSSSVSQQIQF